MKNSKLSDSLIQDPRFLAFLIGWLQNCDGITDIRPPAVELERAAKRYCEYSFKTSSGHVAPRETGYADLDSESFMYLGGIGASAKSNLLGGSECSS